MGSIFAAIKRLSEESQPIVGSVKRPASFSLLANPLKIQVAPLCRKFLSLLTQRALRASYRNSSANFNTAEHCPANANLANFARLPWRCWGNADGKLARTETRETHITLFPFALGNLDPDPGKLNSNLARLSTFASHSSICYNYVDYILLRSFERHSDTLIPEWQELI